MVRDTRERAKGRTDLSIIANERFPLCTELDRRYKVGYTLQHAGSQRTQARSGQMKGSHIRATYDYVCTPAVTRRHRGG